MNLTAIFAVFLLVLTSGLAADELSSAEPVSHSAPSPIQSSGETNHAAQSLFDVDDDEVDAENRLANQPVANSAEFIDSEEIVSPSMRSLKEELEDSSDKLTVSPAEQSTVPLPNDPEPEMRTLHSEHTQSSDSDNAKYSSESKPFSGENELPGRGEVIGESDDDADYLSLEDLNLINEIVQQIPSPSDDGPTSSDTLEARAEKVLELVSQNKSASSESSKHQSAPLDEVALSSTDDFPQLENTVEWVNSQNQVESEVDELPSTNTQPTSPTSDSKDDDSPVVLPEPKSQSAEALATSPPELISLGAINLNLLPPFAEPAIRQYQLNMSLPLLNQLELSLTLQELYQGEAIASEEVAASLPLFETIYQVGVLSGSVASIAQGQLSLLSGTLTVTSAGEAVRLENLSGLDSWRDVQFQLQQASSNLLLVGKLTKSDSPSGEGAVKYFSEVSFSVGAISGRYHLRLERHQSQKSGSRQPCPWISLDHELTTTPEEVLYFHSFIDHICNESDVTNDRPEDSQMNIEINLKSAVWPLANFNLNQTFNFGLTGDELMQASHPLFDIAVDGFWNSDSIYSKTLKIHPSAIGAHFLPFMSSNLKTIFTRIQQADGLSKAYTLNIERSPDLSNHPNRQEQVATSERLSLSFLVVKITSAFISATTIVFSANGALFSEFVSLFELLFDSLFASIEEPYFVYFDMHQFQFAFELTAFVVVFLLFYMLLSFVDLVDTVIRIVLIVLFVEICVATIGVQLISLGYM